MKGPTKDRILQDALTTYGGDIEAAFGSLKDRVGAEKPLIWTYNPVTQGAPKGTPREPLPLAEQYKRCQDRLAQLAKRMGFASSAASTVDPSGNGTAEDGEPVGAEGNGDGNSSGNSEPSLEQLEELAQQAQQKAEQAMAEAEGLEAQLEELKAEAEAATADSKDKLEELAAKVGTEGEEEAEASYEEAKASEKEKKDQLEELKEKVEEAIAAAAEAEEKAKAAAEAVEKAKPSIEDEILRFLREVARLRSFAEDRGMEPFDSLRVEDNGIKAIVDGGLPVDGLLDSLTAAWQSDTREQAEVADFDYAAFGCPTPGVHSSSDYILGLIKANIPVWLYGPAGTSKSTAARQAAKALGLDYYEVNLAGSLPSAVKGKDRLKGFVPSEFVKAYSEGGVIVLEEFDMAHPQTAGAINNAIANGHFHNDADGIVYERHPDFRIIATANTLGIGATHEFNGRVKLDGATLDRFRMGRVRIDRDERLCLHMVNTILEERGISLRV